MGRLTTINQAKCRTVNMTLANDKEGAPAQALHASDMSQAAVRTLPGGCRVLSESEFCASQRPRLLQGDEPPTSSAADVDESQM